jgi:hypothetical protein
MENKRTFLVEKILLITVLIVSVWGFWYFEESLFLRILSIVFALGGVWLVFRKSAETSKLTSQRELLVLFILYLGFLSFYNLLYGMNLPIYVILSGISILTVVTFYSLFGLDDFKNLLGKEVFHVLIALLAIVVLELFLSLYFWPVAPETKSLILVVILYLIMSLVYLHIHSMLRLKRVAGYLVVSFLILGAILLITWLEFGK